MSIPNLFCFKEKYVVTVLYHLKHKKSIHLHFLKIEHFHFLYNFYEHKKRQGKNALSFVYIFIISVSAYGFVGVVICRHTGYYPDCSCFLLPFNSAVKSIRYITELEIIVSVNIVAGCLNGYSVERQKCR